MSVAFMAKKKSKTPKPMVLGMRGSEEWKAWLDEYAESRRLTVVGLIDIVLAEDALRHGFRPPPRR